jgi:predicted NAD/FAD-binding protein
MQDFLTLNRFGEDVKSQYVLPMAVAIWSSPKKAVLNFNALSMLRFYENHGLLNIHETPQWYRVKGGARTYVNRIIEKGDFQVRLSEPVLRVDPRGEEVALTTRQGEFVFDQVVFACHSDQAYAILGGDTNPEYAALAGIRYQHNAAYLHEDTRWLPCKRSLWSAWNYVQKQDQADAAEKPITVTYWMTGMQALPTQRAINVTLNPLGEIAHEKQLHTVVYDHPLLDEQTVQHQQAIGVLQGRNHLWFCGAYLGTGFHEDGLRSSVNLARKWGLPLPWVNC